MSSLIKTDFEAISRIPLIMPSEILTKLQKNSFFQKPQTEGHIVK